MLKLQVLVICTKVDDYNCLNVLPDQHIGKDLMR